MKVLLAFLLSLDYSYTNIASSLDHDTTDKVDVDMEEDLPSTEGPTTSFLPSLVPPLLALTHPTSLSFPPLAAPSPHPPTTSALSAIHISALECLNNVFLSLTTTPNPSISADRDSGSKVWDEIWSALAVTGTETGLGQERRQEMWEVAVGVLWGIGNVWKGSLVSFRFNLHCFLLSLTIDRYQMRSK